MVVKHLPIPGMTLLADSAGVRVASETPLSVLSSAVVGGDLNATRHIVNMHVPKGYHCATPENDLIEFAASLGIAEPFVGMMTAAWTQNAGLAIESRDSLAAIAIITAGLSNLTSAGITPPASLPLGTINIILLLDATLTSSAMANTLITATEAKTMTLVEQDARTPEGHLASGTSTDSIVVACTNRGARLRYAGPASPIGWLTARAVRRALSDTLIRRKATSE